MIKLNLDPLNKHYIYQQIYWRIRQLIAQRQLKPGDKVPSIRDLASSLNISRNTVDQAYQLLITEGYLVAQGPAGTFVAEQLVNYAHVANCIYQGKTRLSSQKAVLSPFQLGLPALDDFPKKTWTRLAGKNIRQMTPDSMCYPPLQGELLLRQAIANYLGISRGVACTAEQIFITSGYCASLNLIFQTLMSANDECWIEDPGYRYTKSILNSLAISAIPIAVDQYGIDVDMGIKLAKNARFAIVTPAHQSPLCMPLSLIRRHALLEWAGQQDAWIIEDDYDSEYRYVGKPLPALKSLDYRQRVLYIGTFSKVLFPGLSLAYLVVPPNQVERFQESLGLLPTHNSTLLQSIVRDFMLEGHFSRHLRRMRTLYSRRREYLINAINENIVNEFCISEPQGGMHLPVYLHDNQKDYAITHIANENGLLIQAISNWSINNKINGLLMGFANFKTQEEADFAIRKLKKLIRTG